MTPANWFRNGTFLVCWDINLYHVDSDIFIVDHILPAKLCMLELNDHHHHAVGREATKTASIT